MVSLLHEGMGRLARPRVRPGQEARSPMADVETKSLPENAYQPLKPGELYPPIVAATAHVPELTTRSIGWGILLCIIFTVASAYSGLKVGQVIDRKRVV